MPGPLSSPAGGKSRVKRLAMSQSHGLSAGCKAGETCSHQPTKRARKIAARKTRVARQEWTRTKGK